MIKKYNVEFVLNSQQANTEIINGSLIEFGENLDVREDFSHNQRIFRVRIDTQEPQIIFDVCSQFGRLGAIKVEEIKEDKN